MGEDTQGRCIMPLHSYFENTDYYRTNGSQIIVVPEDPCYNLIPTSNGHGWNNGWKLQDDQTKVIDDVNYFNMSSLAMCLGIPKIANSLKCVDEFCHRLACYRLVSPHFGIIVMFNRNAKCLANLWDTRLVTKTDVLMWRGLSTNADKITKNKFYQTLFENIQLENKNVNL